MVRFDDVDGGTVERLIVRVHDGPIQVLSAVALRLELLAETVDGDAREVVLGVSADVRDAVETLREELERATPP